MHIDQGERQRASSFIFFLFYRFIYSEDVEINFDNVEGLLIAGDKYFIQLLKDKCICFLKDNLNNDEVINVFKLAFDLNLEELKSNALDFIWKNGAKCLSSDLFLELPPEYVKHIIKSDKLRCKEDIVYEQMVKWATKRNHSERNQSIRDCLGDLLYLIRFPAMEQNYFTRNVSKKGILMENEIINVYQSKTDEERHSSIFISERRHYMLRFKRCFVDDRSVAALECTSKDDSVDFETSFDGKLCSVLLFGPKSFCGSTDVTIKILSGNSVLSTTQKNKLNSHKKIYEIPLNYPVEVFKQRRYTIVVNMRGPKTYKGKYYKPICKGDGLSLTFLPPSISSPTTTSENSGQIPGLGFDVYT